MRSKVRGCMNTYAVKASPIKEPFADSWNRLWEMLVQDGNER